jgi:hypothetical protein
MRDRDDVPLWRPIWQWDWNDWGRWTLLGIWIIAAILSGKINDWAMQLLAWDYGQPRW